LKCGLGTLLALDETTEGGSIANVGGQRNWSSATIQQILKDPVMKKLSLVAIATILAAPAFAGDNSVVPVGVNVSTANGVNVGSVTGLGINNIGVVNQNTGIGFANGVHLDSAAFTQNGGEITINSNAYTIGSLVNSGNGGAGGEVTVIAVNAAIAASRNETEQFGLAGALAVPVAITGQGVAAQDATTNANWQVPVNIARLGDGNAASSNAGANAGALQANVSGQKSITAAGAAQGNVGQGIDSSANGKAFIVTIDSNNTFIKNTSISKIQLDTTVNIADRGGVAGGLKVDDSFNKLKIEDSLNNNAVANDHAVAVSAANQSAF
jgi:hypothetical protein